MHGCFCMRLCLWDLVEGDWNQRISCNNIRALWFCKSWYSGFGSQLFDIWLGYVLFLSHMHGRVYIYISSLAWFRHYEESSWDDAFSVDFLFLERSVDRGEGMALIRLPIFARVVKLIKSAFHTCRTFFSRKKGNLLFTCLNFSFWLINF